ncbi:MAG: hypothetical protein L3J32_01190 [Rhizobiaceae bacterium]|nr:hypothetical protein [Rhizobiaceae bacterium]
MVRVLVVLYISINIFSITQAVAERSGKLETKAILITTHPNEGPVKGDFEYGEYLAAECVTCHSATGKDKGIPPITGWDAEGFISVMNAYKIKDLENPAMQLIAARLDEEQMASLALYFATLPEAE